MTYIKPMKKLLLTFLTLFIITSCSLADKTPIDEHTKNFDKENQKYENIGDDFEDGNGYVYERQSGKNGIVGKWKTTTIGTYENGNEYPIYEGIYEFKSDGYLTFSKTTYVGYFHTQGTGKYTIFTEDGVVKVKINTVSEKRISETNTYILNVNSKKLKLANNLESE